MRTLSESETDLAAGGIEANNPCSGGAFAQAGLGGAANDAMDVASGSDRTGAFEANVIAQALGCYIWTARRQGSSSGYGPVPIVNGDYKPLMPAVPGTNGTVLDTGRTCVYVGGGL